MMQRQAWWIGFLALAFVAACSRTIEAPEPNLVIAPDDFVVLPCHQVASQTPCALIVAGGKRVLFGAPTGAATSLANADLEQLDAILLFSLRASDIEGLDDVRNQSWRAGRDSPLLTVGPAGVQDFVTAINKAYEQPDALRVVEDGIPPGGFDAAVLKANTAAPGQVVFDTGDLRIERLSDGYLIFYEQSEPVALLLCGGASRPEAGAVISCADDGPDIIWPIAEPIFIESW